MLENRVARTGASLVALLIAICSPSSACQTYTAAQVAAAIQNSPNASSALKASACTFGGASSAESGGNTCASNGANFGVLQLSTANVTSAGYPNTQDYLNATLQQQVDAWVQTAGGANQGAAYNTINSSIGQSINGVSMTQGMAAACVQFGGGICQRDLAAIQAGGACPTDANGGIRATKATLANGTANLDGNGQSICSWGQVIQQRIASSGCANTGAGCTANGQGDFPATASPSPPNATIPV